MNLFIEDTATEFPLFGAEIKPLWVEGLPDEQYHAFKEYMSSGGIRELLISPQHFLHRYILEEKAEPTEAMILGKLIHAAVLEPERFRDCMVTEPLVDKRTSQGRQIIQQFRDSLKSHAIVCTVAQFRIIEGILKSLREHTVAWNLLKGGKKEVSGFGFDQETGVACRIRPDFLRDDLIGDVKTCESAHPRDFSRALWNYRYDVSTAFYLDRASQIIGQPLETYLFVAIEKKPPYAIGVYIADFGAIEKGRESYQKALKTYVECREKNFWPGYQQEAQMIGLPHWAFYDEE